MARAAQDACREAARLGLLIGVTACAVIEDPPGGPPDFTPPVVTAVIPDSGSVDPGLDKPLRIEFDEVISEQSGGGLDKLIRFSPRTSELGVSWKRRAIEIEPKDGWRNDAVYRVVLLPGIADLRNNRMEEGRTIVFTTGGEIPQTALTGTALDWEDGKVGRQALVQATLLPDSLVYSAVADSTGEFALTEIPRGEYWLTVSVDANSNGIREPREPFDSVTVTLDSAETGVYWMVARDTLGPQVRDVSEKDSLTLELTFSQKLRPGVPDSGAVSLWLLPDTVAVPGGVLWQAATYDSLVAAEKAKADSIAKITADSLAKAAADSAAAADSLAAPEDTAAAQVPARAPARAAAPSAAQRAGPGQPTAAPADTSRAAQLLRERPALSDKWYLHLPSPLAPGRYLIGARAFNVMGILAESQRAFSIEAKRDST